MLLTVERNIQRHGYPFWPEEMAMESAKEKYPKGIEEMTDLEFQEFSSIFEITADNKNVH